MFRPVEKQELSRCAGVIRESFLTVAKEFNFTPENAPRFTAFSVTEERLRFQMEEEKRPMTAFVCEDGGIAGYYSLSLQGQDCELNNLCVLPQYRHGGIGKSLLDHAFAEAKERGCTKMKIGIVEENRVLRRWYEKAGFVHVGTKKFGFFPFTCGYLEKAL